jgi:hypothetical protein
MVLIVPDPGAMWAQTDWRGFLEEEGLDLVLRGWAEDRRMTLAGISAFLKG